ncbi:MAG: ABC transporter substrate-binding protein [Candidatus Methylomirabilia bacterium]
MTTTNEIPTHEQVSRRAFLRTAGVGVAGASVATMLAAKQAPAARRGTSLRILQWSHFIPAYDVWFDKFARDWGKANGVKVRVDHIPHLEIPARLAAEFAAKAGHDLVYFVGTIQTALYFRHLVDVTDISEQLGKRWGSWIPGSLSLAVVEGRWHAIPDFYILLPMLWRKDLFDQNNLKPPDTWELARVAARTLKPKGHPTGIAMSHCNDANLVWRSVLFSFDGKEADGENILIDSKETRGALRFAKALFDEGMTPEVFAWDDASDNRYLASGIACWIHDAISAYRTTEDTNPPVFRNTHIGLEPLGPGGNRIHDANANAYAIWKFAKNPQAAKDFVVFLIDHWKDSMIASRGYNMPMVKAAYKKPMPVLGTDPNGQLQKLQDFPDFVRFHGYPGPFTPAIQEIVATHVLNDMFTKAGRGQSPDAIVNWGMGEYRRIFSKHYKRG